MKNDDKKGSWERRMKGMAREGARNGDLLPILLMLAALCVLGACKPVKQAEAVITATAAAAPSTQASSAPPAPPLPQVTETAAGTRMAAATIIPPTDTAPPLSTAAATASALPATVAETGSPRGVVRRALPNGRFCPLRGAPPPPGARVIGRSQTCDLPLLSYTIGTGRRVLVLIGGIHGGYEWNTIRLAEEMYGHLRQNPNLIPPALTVIFIPNANPDGLFAVAGAESGDFDAPLYEDSIPGRLNGRGVDLNRNWDCLWRPEAVWGSTPVSGGPLPFSEAETRALRDFLLTVEPAAVLFWHSAATGVYPGSCLREDARGTALAEVFAGASGYKLFASFDGYAISGHATGWLAAQGIPALTVELTTHSALDFEENLAGLEALMARLAGDGAEADLGAR